MWGDLFSRYGPEFPSYNQLLHSTQLHFINSDPFFEPARPILHKMIYVGGLTMQDSQPLDEVAKYLKKNYLTLAIDRWINFFRNGKRLSTMLILVWWYFLLDLSPTQASCQSRSRCLWLLILSLCRSYKILFHNVSYFEFLTGCLPNCIQKFTIFDLNVSGCIHASLQSAPSHSNMAAWGRHYPCT